MSEGKDQPPSTLLFIHIPKTGGRTLLRLTKQQFHPDRTFEIYGDIDPSLDRFRSLPVQTREGLELVAGHYPFGLHKLIPGRFAYLTMLREPTHRVVSDFWFMKQRPGHWAYERIQREGLTLDDVLDKGLQILMDNGQTRILSSAKNLVPYGQCGRMHLEEAKENLQRYFPVVGITERFDESFAAMKRAYGWKGWRVRSRNVSPTRPKPLQPKTRRRVEALSELDRELYEFAHGLLDQQLSSIRGARTAARLVSGTNTLGALSSRVRNTLKKRGGDRKQA